MEKLGMLASAYSNTCLHGCVHLWECALLYAADPCVQVVK